MKTKTVKELRAEAKALGVPRYSKMRKAELMEAIAAHHEYDPSANSAKSYSLAINVMRDKLASFRREQIGDCTLYLGDCRELLPLLPKVDAVVTDPPYGIGADRSMHEKGGTRYGSAMAAKRHYEATDWDRETADDTVAAAIEMAKWAVVFGGNYYDLPPSRCWFVWDKKVNGEFADCELAWTNLDKPVRRIEWLWNGMLRRANEKRFEHPTQKPVGVMKWCIDHLPEPNRTILDPFMGSGTTGVACVKLGRKFIGIEIEERYFDIARRRIEEAYKQPDMFVQPTSPKSEQLALQVA